MNATSAIKSTATTVTSYVTFLVESHGALCSLWSGVMEQSAGVEYWSGVESDFGVANVGSNPGITKHST